MAYPYEQGVTLYVDKADYEELKTNENTAKLITSEEEKGIAGPAFVDDDGTILNHNVYKYVPYEVSEDGKLTFTANKAQSLLQPNVIDQAASSGYMMPSVEYWAAIDDFVLNAATYLSEVESPLVSYDPENPTFSEASPEYIAELTVDDINPYKNPNEVDASGKLSEPNNDSILRNYGYVKFAGKDDALFGYLKQWNAILYASDDPDLGMDNVPTEDFFNAYCNAVSTKVNANRSCIATQDGFFGHYGAHSDWEVAITKKSWGYAWSKGFLEGLLVYPVSWLLDTFAFSMDPALSGFGQILALVFVTLIVRGFIMLISFKSTMDTQKMQALQPELAKIQAKYPNSNTNQAEKARLDISTVSRVSSSKYVQTNFGIYPLKFFFSDGYTTESGEELSVREIKRILKECVAGEDKGKPYTDDELADMLKEKGYPIARRTVAKYRQQLNIPVARLRR